jgi:hypothetical protein
VNGHTHDMEDAEAQLYRRIQELRARAREAAGAPPEEPAAAAAAAPVTEPGPRPDARDEATLAREESLADDLRSIAATLERSLPDRVERAVQRSLEAGATARAVAELADLVRGLARQVEQLNRDLLAERLGRIEDLELTLDLFTTGITAMRDDLAAVFASVERVGGGMESVALKLDQPLSVTVERIAGREARPGGGA